MTSQRTLSQRNTKRLIMGRIIVKPFFLTLSWTLEVGCGPGGYHSAWDPKWCVPVVFRVSFITPFCNFQQWANLPLPVDFTVNTHPKLPPSPCCTPEENLVSACGRIAVLFVIANYFPWSRCCRLVFSNVERTFKLWGSFVFKGLPFGCTRI